MSSRGLWTMEGADVERLGQRPGGDDFAALVDTVIRPHAHALGIPQGDIETMSRTDVADDGVDTRVRTGTAREDPTGWLTSPTTWQYKATQAKNLDKLRAKFSSEIRKPAVQQDLRAGYAYRYCVASVMTAQRKKNWREKLTELARSVYHSSFR